MKKIITFINVKDGKHLTIYDENNETSEIKKGDVLRLGDSIAPCRHCKVTKVNVVKSYLTEKPEPYRCGFVFKQVNFVEERFELTVYVKPIG